MRFFLFSVISLLVHLLSAADVRLTVTVVDDCGNPVSNAVVVVQTLKSLVSGCGSRPDHFLWASNSTDGAGIARIQFRCLTADFSCYVAAENHYPEKNLHGRFRARENSNLAMDLLDTATNLSFTLYRKINPTPMYSHDLVERRKIPSDNGRWGYDLQIGDWVFPFGKGLTSDFLLEFHLLQTDTAFECHGGLIFESPYEGCYRLRRNGSQVMQTVYAADTNGIFVTNLCFRSRLDLQDHSRSFRETLLDENEYLVLRTRVKTDKEGNVVSANYSKIFGPIKFQRRYFELRQTTFNPNVNDPNLESDPSRNLNRNLFGGGLP